MVLIIAGCRTFENLDILEAALADHGIEASEVEEVVSGCAEGADRMGERWAALHGIPVKQFPADWDRHGKAAGPIRNRQMAEYAASRQGRLLAIWDGNSKGTQNMILQAQILKVPTHVHYPLPQLFRSKGGTE